VSPPAAGVFPWIGARRIEREITLA
jgi:hypothetical protein